MICMFPDCKNKAKIKIKLTIFSKQGGILAFPAPDIKVCRGHTDITYPKQLISEGSKCRAKIDSTMIENGFDLPDWSKSKSRWTDI